jgi:hypothetical protein
MDASERISSAHAYDRLAIVSFVLGLATLIFPIVSIVYLIAVNGGPGYLQSIFCGIPVALGSIIAGVVSLAQGRRKNQAGHWMVMLGIVFGSLFFVISSVMVFILIFPFLSGTAH